MESLETLITPSLNGILSLFSLYLSGVYYQGTGDLETALRIFADRRFEIGDSANSGTPAKLEVCLLSAMNRVWILQEPSLRDDVIATELLDQLQIHCADHHDIDIRTAFNIVLATAQTIPPLSINQVKVSIQTALNGSKVTGNTHCLAIALNIMRCRLFENVVGEQALKSAKAASLQAKRSGNLLWMSVADGMLAHSHEVQGQLAEAQQANEAATRFASLAFIGDNERGDRNDII
jgi:hypothetical protein